MLGKVISFYISLIKQTSQNIKVMICIKSMCKLHCLYSSLPALGNKRNNMSLSSWENDKEKFGAFNLYIYFKVFWS